MSPTSIRFASGAILGLVVLVGAACGPSGSGNIVTEERSVGDFSEISVSEGIHVELTVDPAADASVAVTFDDNLLGRVVTEVRGGTLHIEFGGSVRIVGDGRFVSVVARTLDGIEVSAGAEVTGTGEATRYDLRASGGSTADLRNLMAADVDIEASGGSSALVYASAAAEVDASGGSSVTVYGNPTDVDVETSGGSGVDVAE